MNLFSKYLQDNHGLFAYSLKGESYIKYNDLIKFDKDNLLPGNVYETGEEMFFDDRQLIIFLEEDKFDKVCELIKRFNVKEENICLSVCNASVVDDLCVYKKVLFHGEEYYVCSECEYVLSSSECKGMFDRIFPEE